MEACQQPEFSVVNIPVQRPASSRRGSLLHGLSKTALKPSGPFFKTQFLSWRLHEQTERCRNWIQAGWEELAGKEDISRPRLPLLLGLEGPGLAMAMGCPRNSSSQPLGCPGNSNSKPSAPVQDQFQRTWGPGEVFRGHTVCQERVRICVYERTRQSQKGTAK